MAKSYYSGWLDAVIRSLYESGLNPNQIYLKLREDFKETPGLKLPAKQTIYNYCATFNEETQNEHEAAQVMQLVQRATMRWFKKNQRKNINE